MSIKLIPAPSDEVRARVEQEVAIGRSVDSPHVLLPTSWFETDQEIGVVYPLVLGETVETLLRAGPLAPADAVAVAAAAARGLAVVHARGFVHRDLKPANLLIPFHAGRPQFERAIVMDFGVLGELRQSVGTTIGGMVVGTPAYMSPEQLSGSEQGPATDVYGLATVLYEMLYGRRLYQAENLYALMEEITTGAVVLPDIARGPRVPGTIRRLLRQSLAKSMADRPRDASEFLARLERAAIGMESTPAVRWASAAPKSFDLGPVQGRLGGPPAISSRGPGPRGTPSPDAEGEVVEPGDPYVTGGVDDEVAEQGEPPDVAQELEDTPTIPGFPARVAPGPSPHASRPASARRGRLGVLVAAVVAGGLAVVSGFVLSRSGASSPSAWTWLVFGLCLIAAGVAGRSAVHRYLAGRESELSRHAANLLSGAESRDSLTQSLSIRLDELWEQCKTGEQEIVWHTVAMMVREYKDARDSGDRQSALMNMVTLVGELQRRLSPWYVRHEKLVSFGVGMVGIASGLVSTAVAIAKALGK